jgi:hypothetical protein
MVWLSSPLAKVAILGIAVLGLAVPSVKRRSAGAGAIAEPPAVVQAVHRPAPAPTFEPSRAAAVAAAAVPAASPATGDPKFDDLEREIQQMLGNPPPTQQRPAA